MRITGEFIEGFDRLANVTKAVTVFGSARVGPSDPGWKMAGRNWFLAGGLAVDHGGGWGTQREGVDVCVKVGGRRLG